MTKTRDQAAFLKAKRFLIELKGINHQMTLTEAIILLDVASHESGEPPQSGQPRVGMPMQMIRQQHFPDSSRQYVSRVMRTLETGIDARGGGDGVELVEFFNPQEATDKRAKAVRLKPAAREHLRSALRKAFPNIYEGMPHETNTAYSNPKPACYRESGAGRQEEDDPLQEKPEA